MRLLSCVALAAAIFALPAIAETSGAKVSDGPPWAGLQVLKGKRSYIDTPLAQVHVTVLGDGKPLLLLHQTPWFSVQYATAMPVIAKAGIKAIALDTPGYGMSTLPDHPPTAEEYADNLIPVLDRLGIKKVAVAGHHTGSTIAAALASRHPDRVACVMMHGIPLYTPEEREDRMKNQLHPETALKRDGTHFTDRWAFLQKYVKDGATTESIQWSVLGFLIAGNTEWYGHQAAYTFDMAGAIKGIKAPTLILSNTADTIHEAAKRTLKMRPDFAYHEFPGGTSHMIYDEPVAWSAPVTAFMNEKCAAAG